MSAANPGSGMGPAQQGPTAGSPFFSGAGVGG
jgi:hypothetical protein